MTRLHWRHTSDAWAKPTACGRLRKFFPTPATNTGTARDWARKQAESDVPMKSVCDCGLCGVGDRARGSRQCFFEDSLSHLAQVLAAEEAEEVHHEFLWEASEEIAMAAAVLRAWGRRPEVLGEEEGPRKGRQRDGAAALVLHGELEGRRRVHHAAGSGRSGTRPYCLPLAMGKTPLGRPDGLPSSRDLTSLCRSVRLTSSAGGGLWVCQRAAQGAQRAASSFAFGLLCSPLVGGSGARSRRRCPAMELGPVRNVAECKSYD